MTSPCGKLPQWPQTVDKRKKLIYYSFSEIFYFNDQFRLLPVTPETQKQKERKERRNKYITTTQIANSTGN